MTRPSHLLLAVAGTTPATITEAAYGLAVTRKQPLGEIRILTTQGGFDRLHGHVEVALINMQNDYPRARFPSMVNWRIFALPDGTTPIDIRTSEQSEQMADWMVQQVTQAVADTPGIVYASLAGGRKTMSFYLGAAMQLVARPTDRLLHVLVDPRFETDGFLYPAPTPGRTFVGAPDGQRLDTHNAHVEVSDLAFVPLRGLLDTSRLPASSFRNLVARASDALSAAYLEVRVVTRKNASGFIEARVDFVPSPPAQQFELTYRNATNDEFQFYAWLLDRRRRGEPPVRLTDPATFEVVFHDFVSFRTRLIRADKDEEMNVLWELWKKTAPKKRPDFLQQNWYKGYFSAFPSRLRKRLHKLFANHAPCLDPEKYTIKTISRCVYQVEIPPTSITFEARQ